MKILKKIITPEKILARKNNHEHNHTVIRENMKRKLEGDFQPRASFKSLCLLLKDLNSEER